MLSTTLTSSVDIDPANMRKVVEHLAAFNTRNTSSPELEQAASWVADQFKKIPGLNVELMHYTIQAGPRVPETKEVVQVVATLPGTSDRRVIIGGHMDSINMTPQANVFTSRAPGANDDLSGVSLTMECARVMSQKHWDHTLVFVAFSGEEQGLLGSAALAKKAKEEGWKIDGVLSNDMVGNSGNNLGEKDDKNVRVFSEDLPTHHSRELARYIQFIEATRTPADKPFFDPSVDRKSEKKQPFGIKLVFRKDRFGRGGDHSSFNDQGFTAVRFVEVFEEYTRQHTPLDLPEHVDFNYAANVARANLLTASALAQAGAPPTHVRVKRDQAQDTIVTWQGDAPVCVLYWRDTASPIWQGSMRVSGKEAKVVKINKDDHIFAVGVPGGIPVIAE